MIFLIVARRYYIFCDESAQTKHRYMLLGGLIVSDDFIDLLKAEISKVRELHDMYSEYKWVKVSKGKIKAYVSFISSFFKLAFSEHNFYDLNFSSLVIDTSKLDHKRFNRNDPEIGFYKMYYQLLLHKFGDFARDGSSLYVLLDKRTTKYKLSNLKIILNRGWRKKTNIDFDPYKYIKPIDSKKSGIMQIVDVLLGTISYEVNSFYEKANKTSAKKKLVDYVKSCLNIRSFKRNISLNEFSVWHFRLKNNARGG